MSRKRLRVYHIECKSNPSRKAKFEKWQGWVRSVVSLANRVLIHKNLLGLKGSCCKFHDSDNESVLNKPHARLGSRNNCSVCINPKPLLLI